MSIGKERKYTVTMELVVRKTYEIDLDSESYEFAQHDIDAAVQTDASNTFDDPALFLEDENVRFEVRLSVKGHGKHNVVISDDEEND
jgi:hypothetical protein